MNTRAYLGRIGYNGSLRPSLEVLRRLHRQHLLTVPFENLDIHLGRPIILGNEAFYDKIVKRSRGGFCYELNGSFATLLKTLGFRVSMLSARVAKNNRGFTPEFDHMTLLVRLKERWLADVGFGDSFIQPKRADSTLPQREDGRVYRITPKAGGKLVSRWDERDRLWKPQYLFQLRPRRLEEFVPRCRYQQTSPESHFRKGPMCTRLTTEGRVTLTDKKLIETRGNKRVERRLTTEREFNELLKRRFAIDLDNQDEAGFPDTRRFNLGTSREVEDAISRWNIGPVGKWVVAEKGEVNRNFVLSAKAGKYVLRQVLSHSHYQRSSNLEFELGYLNYLKKAGFPYHVPSAIPTRTGKLFANIRGHYNWLYKFIEGTVVERLNESRFTQLTKMMGTYHHLVERSGLNNGKPSVDLYGRASTLKEMETYRLQIHRKRRLNREDAAFMEESARLIPLLRSLDERPYSNLKRYPIHRDIIPENLIWQGAKLVGLIDFEHVSGTNEPTVKDIAVAIQFICKDKKVRHRLDLKLSSRFLRSYRKWHSVSDRETRLIPNLLASGFIEDFVWAFWMLRNDPERARPDVLKLYSTAALWSYENREEITRALLSQN